MTRILARYFPNFNFSNCDIGDCHLWVDIIKHSICLLRQVLLASKKHIKNNAKRNVKKNHFHPFNLPPSETSSAQNTVNHFLQESQDIHRLKYPKKNGSHLPLSLGFWRILRWGWKKVQNLRVAQDNLLSLGLY